MIFVDESYFKKLDSSIKKVPPFIKKLNTNIRPENETSILNEMAKVPQFHLILHS